MQDQRLPDIGSFDTISKFRRNNILFYIKLWGYWTYIYMYLLAIL